MENKEDIETGTMDESCLLNAMDCEGLTQEKFDVKYGRITPLNTTCAETTRQWCRANCKCSQECCKDFIASELPIIDVVRTYKPRQYLLGDVFSGVSLGVLNIPQGMGYALLAAVAPIHGIYTSLFAPLVYVVFGTSRHIAMGVMALSSLLVADVVTRETVALQEAIEAAAAVGNDTVSVLEEQLAAESIEICVVLTLLCGVFSYLMGVFRLGFITDYLGDAFLAGFLSASNVRVMTSQVIQLLQVKVHPYVGPLSFIYTFIDLFKHIHLANIASLVISVISLAIILAVKYAVNEKFKSKLKVPVPIDIIVVIIVTIICYFCKFEARYGVRIIKEIPSGVPMPTVPQIQRSGEFIVDGLILALVGYIIGYMMVKVFSQRHHYTCDANQEFKALGVCNFVGSFFTCIPCSTSPPRCFIMEQTGGNSQFANVISGFIVMVFLFFAGPLLEPMPVCVLNVLIIAGSVPIFAYYKMLFLYWHTNKYDFAIFVVTFVSMITLTINLGIICGIAFSVLTVVYRTQRSYSGILTPVHDSTTLVARAKYSKLLQDLNRIRIFQFAGPLYFATLAGFKQRLFAATLSPTACEAISKVKETVDNKPDEITENPNGEIEIGDVKSSTPLTGRRSVSPSKSSGSTETEKTGIHRIIIDASAISFVDTGGAKMLALMRTQYSSCGVELIVACCNESVKEQIECVVECRDLREKGMSPSVQDAIRLLKSF